MPVYTCYKKNAVQQLLPSLGWHPARHPVSGLRLLAARNPNFPEKKTRG